MRIFWKAIVLSSSLFGLGAYGQGVNDDEALRILNQGGDLFRKNSLERINSLPEGERQGLIQYYRRKIENPTGALTNPAFLPMEKPLIEKRLLFLGDSKVVEDRIQALRSPRGFYDALVDLTDSARPEAIPGLAEIMLIDEPFYRSPPTDTGSSVPRSYSAAGAILAIVARAPVFPTPVKEWARKQQVPVNQLMPVARKWWFENESLLRRKDYASVMIGEDLSGAYKREVEEAILQDSKLKAAQTRENQVVRKNIGDAGGSHSSSVNLRAPRIRYWIGAGVAILLSAAVLGAYFRHRRTRAKTGTY